MDRIYSSVFAGNVNLGSNVTKSLWLLNPANTSIKIIEWGLGLDNGTTNAEPLQVLLYRVQTLGAAAGGVGGSTPWDDALEVTGNGLLLNLTTEPTTINNIGTWLLQPNS